MEQISVYLQKFLTIGLGDRIIRTCVREVILEETGENLNEKNIKIEKDRIKIEVSGSIKSEIFIKKAKIEKKFQERLRNFNIKNPKKII